jgi:NAD(P)-dependent dehydrogenase (short-subunit alcohol dehydrogenase family)
MIDAGRGTIILVASKAGVSGGSGSFAYGASKGGMHGLAMTLERHLGPKGVRVNDVCPGDVDTPLYRRSIEEAVRNGADPAWRRPHWPSSRRRPPSRSCSRISCRTPPRAARHGLHLLEALRSRTRLPPDRAPRPPSAPGAPLHGTALAALMAQRLTAAGYRVAADRCHGRDRRAAARHPTAHHPRDLDGLPVQDLKTTPYASANPGVTHACGHDVHLTVVLAAAERLAAAGVPAGRLTIVFQPAEERPFGEPSGAQAMLDDGAPTTATRRGPGPPRLADCPRAP